MKRLTLLVLLGLLGVVSTGFGYDGPVPVTYDRTIDSIRVVMTTQTKMAVDGKSHFSLTAYVPMDYDGLNQPVDIEIRKSTAAGDTVLAQCTYVPGYHDVQHVIAIPCNRDEYVPYTPSEGTLSIYPYVIRRSREDGQKIHDGSAFKIPVEFVHDDEFEDNEGFATARHLGSLATLDYTDLVSRDADYYRITVPAGREVTEVALNFWHNSADLDLFIYNAARELVGVSDSYTNHELVWFAVTPGADYFIRVHNFSNRPAFYDLSVVHGTRQTVTIINGPGGSPNPVAPGGQVNMFVDAYDWNGSPLSFQWTASCPSLPGNGSFVSSTLQNTIWDAPTNPTGVQKTCTITVTALNGAGQTDTGSYVQYVDPDLDYITFLDGPSGTPNPVAPGGVVQLTAAALDSMWHPLQYHWTASCPFGQNGTFTPSAFTANPTWTAPTEAYGVEQACTLEVATNDAFNHGATASYTQVVERSDVVSFPTPPTATPNPVASAGTVTLAATAIDSLGHAVTYAWQASCPLPTNGTFVPNATTQNPMWVAPPNITGVPNTCTLTVQATDGNNITGAAVVAVVVNSIPDVVTINAGPTSSTNPVPSGGTTALSVGATDTIGHVLSYVWTASCPGGIGSGSFVPGQTSQNPTWVAPQNFSGADQTCTLTVVASDGYGHTDTASIPQVVGQEPHMVTITGGPTGTPNPVSSQATATVSVTATDSYPHTLGYAWSATCPALGGPGTFGPAGPSTTWTAPLNVTASSQACTISVLVDDGHGETATATMTMVVNVEPHSLTLTGPSGSPNPVASAGVVTLGLTAFDPYPHVLTYAWSATCPVALGSSGSFLPSASSALPTWQAPTNLTGATQTCTITVTVDDGAGQTVTNSYLQHVSTGPNAITINTPPAATPNPVASAGTVALIVDASTAWGNPLTYSWTSVCPTLSGPGTFAPSAAGPSPSWIAPANLTGAPQTCVLTVTITDGTLTSTATVNVVVNSVPHTLTTTGPTATPDPVNPGGTVVLLFSATDSLLHPLTYAWTADCPTLGSNGVFKPSPSIAQPVWVAPFNTTGVEQLCTLTVVVDDGHGETQTHTVVVRVNPTPHLINITSAPQGSPNPVSPSGTVNLGVGATDTYGHSLTYSWQAACPTLGSNGVLVNANTATPSWTAPENPTGSPQSCLMTVTISDGLGETVAVSYEQIVRTPTHEILITTGPSGSPNPVASEGTVVLHLAAEDTFSHALTYAWSAVCPGLASGSFFPTHTTGTPTWTAPENKTGASVACTLTVNITDGQGQSATASFTETVSSVADAVTITAGPTATPDVVASAGSVALAVTASDSLDHPITYAWQAVCAGLPSSGSFTPSPTVASPTWAAPENLTGTPQNCTMSLTATDGQGQSDSASVLVRVEPKPDLLTVTEGPSSTPNPVDSGGIVTLTFAAIDSLDHAIAYAWQAACPGLPGPGTFAPSASVASPTWTAPANLTGASVICTLQVTANDGHGHEVNGTVSQQVSSLGDSITITAPASASPNPVMSGASTNLSVAATDTLNHAITYGWSAVCPSLPGTGTFSSTSVATPTWTAPINQTSADQACTLTVTMTDGHGQTETSSVTVQVEAANEITLGAGITSTNNPVGSGLTTTLTVAATNALNRPLTYAWTSICPGLGADGTFAQPAAFKSTWVAPDNTTGVPQTCTIQVFVSDGSGYSATATLAQGVRPLNNIVFTQSATAAPNPVASQGTVTLNVAATSDLGFPLSFDWSASCPTLGSSGAFANPAVANTTWVAPANLTGASQTCTLSVTVADGVDANQTSPVSVVVLSAPQVFTVSGPQGTPNPVISGGTVNASITANNALGRPMTFEWSAVCTGLGSNGTFAAPASATTAWLAPTNLTGTAKSCVISVTLRDDLTAVLTRSYTQVVGTNPVVVTSLTGGDVGSGGTVGVNVLGPDLTGQPLTYAWTSVCPGLPSHGSFNAPSSASPIWNAPANTTGVPQVCTLTVLIQDGQGQSQTASFNVTVGAMDCSYDVTPGSATLPASGGTATFTVTATPACPWTATPNAGWVQFSGSPSGTGDGSFTVSLPATTDPEERVSTIAVGSASVQVRQGGKGYTYFLAEGATINQFFDTRIALLNHDATRTATVNVDFQLKDTTTVLTHTLTLGPHQRGTVQVSQLAQSIPALAVLASAEFSTVVRSNVPLVVDRTMSWDSTGYGGHSETSIDAASSIWYLAEGATIGDFELYYLIQNPNAVALSNEIEVTYMLPPPAAPIVRTYSMGANTRMNIAVHLEAGLENAEVSAIVRTPAGKPVIVERAMYLSAGGLFYGAGHESAGIREPRTQWFFAEGATGEFFDLFILIGNPNDQPAHVTATYLFDDGVTCTAAVGNAGFNGTPVVGAKSRQNIWVDLETVPGCPHDLADAAVSTTINSDIPIVAERTMWWPGPSAATWAEAHNTAGATSTGTTWALADGEQGFSNGVETYVLVANTSSFAGRVKVTLFFEDGTTVQKSVDLLGRSRTTVPIGPEFGAVAQNRRFGVVVESQTAPGQSAPAQIVVERATYWNGPGAAFWAAGTNALATKLQ